jgi:esterase
MDSVQTFPAADGVSLTVKCWRPPAPQAPALILLHGAASNSSRWWHLLSQSSLRDHHLILRPDLRGHGASLWRGPATLTHWCDDLLTLLNQHRLTRAVLVGHCLGANLALHFAARHPQRCAGLVLIEPMPRTALRGTLATLSHLRPLLQLLIKLARLANHLGWQRALSTPDLQLLDQQQHQAGHQALAKRYGSPRQDLKAVPTAQYFSNLLQVLSPLPDPLPRCPTLAVLPQGRRMTDPEATRRALSSIPNLSTVVLEAEHWIPTRQADALRATIDAWVADTFPASEELESTEKAP